MEVKIGVHNAPRELVIESTQTPDEVAAAVRAALADEKGVLELTDERGRHVVVRSTYLAYVEIGEQLERRVGFGSL
ncbi:DUF3107 domain-containing protein [Phytoactinopolyspora halotolerans]|uniref:DUF3107 domain-containing protein n=1 Tax=Phytoactinopolyspora halotolerans TaxID=1981512 RepID=A0A6L9SIG6_9ACTN|nr:DUF3107 domain-containing protein [Phytoactinopolyspora halotolerans]